MAISKRKGETKTSPKKENITSNNLLATIKYNIQLNTNPF